MRIELKERDVTYDSFLGFFAYLQMKNVLRPIP